MSPGLELRPASLASRAEPDAVTKRTRGPRLRLEPLLAIQRELYELPRDFSRFERYIEVMTGGGDDIELPLSVMNPMGKEHVPETLDALIALDAEGVAEQALEEASERLPGVQGVFEVGLVLADDRKGGWTDRHMTDLQARFEPRAELNRGWIVVTLWTGEPPSVQGVRTNVLATVYRRFHYLRQGKAKTLGRMMEQEGRALHFAGLTEPALEPEDLAYTREVIDPHRETTEFPLQFACLYGDGAAKAKGYRPLGLSEDAGWALALAEARGSGEPPEAALG